MPFMLGLRKAAAALKPRRPVAPVTQNAESLFDVPEPYRSMALDIDAQMLDIEKANRMNDPWDDLLHSEQIARARAEREARNQLYELAERRRMLIEDGMKEAGR